MMNDRVDTNISGENPAQNTVNLTASQSRTKSASQTPPAFIPTQTSSSTVSQTSSAAQTPQQAGPVFTAPQYTAQNSAPTYVCTPRYVPANPLRAPADGKDRGFAIAFLVASIIGVDFGVFGRFALGFSIACTVLILLACVYSARGNRVKPFGVYCAVCAVTIGCTFAMYNSGFSKFLQVIAIFVLTAIMLLNFTDCCGLSDKSNHVGSVARLMFVTPFERIGATFGSLHLQSKNGEKRKRTGALIGVLCAIPVLLVIIPLLASSDAAFEGLLSKLSFDDLPRLIGAVILGSLLFMLLFSAVFAAAKKIVIDDRYNVPNQNGSSQKGIPAAGTCGFLGAISSVYVVYILSQISYFFGAFSRLLPENYTVAEYARRGFFEMSVICAINLVLIGLSIKITRRDENGNTPRSTRMLCLFIALFSIAVDVTVCAKLALYMSNFGLTLLRVYTTVFSIMLAVIFVCVILRLVCRRFPAFKTCVAMIAALGVVVSIVDANTTVARYNYYAYTNGVLNEVDVDTIAEMGDAGVGFLVALLDDSNSEVAADAAYKLVFISDRYGYNSTADMMIEGYYEYDEYGEYSYRVPIIVGDLMVDDEGDFRSYNATYENAKRSITHNWEKIKRVFNANNQYYSKHNGV